MRIVPHGHKLPEEEHQRRLAAYRQGMTDPEIARALGVSLSTITNWRNRAGLRRANKRQNKFSAEPLKPIRKSDAPSQEELAYYKEWLRDWAGVS